jgi:werner syndrome-like exonuclease
LDADHVKVHYTDNERGDAAFFESIFPGLKPTSVPSSAKRGVEAREGIRELHIPADHGIFYAKTMSDAEHHSRLLRLTLEQQDDVERRVGLDAEWPVLLTGARQAKLATLQVTTAKSTVVYQLSALPAVPQFLISVLQDPLVAKVGVGVRGDLAKLHRDHGVLGVGGIDLGVVARQKNIIAHSQSSLSGLSQLVLGRSLSKPRHLRFSQ